MNRYCVLLTDNNVTKDNVFKFGHSNDCWDEYPDLLDAFNNELAFKYLEELNWIYRYTSKELYLWDEIDVYIKHNSTSKIYWLYK